MGIIIKQSIRNVILAYAGTIFGFINASILMPKFLAEEQVGLLEFIDKTAKIFAALASIGFPLVIIVLFPKYKQSSNQGGFLTFITMVSLIGIGLGLTAYTIFYENLLGDIQYAKSYYFFSIGFMIIFSFRLMFVNLDPYLKMMTKTVIGALLENLLAKLLFTFALIAYVLGVFNFDMVFWARVFVLAVPGIGLIIYLVYIKEKFFDFKYRQRYIRNRKEIATVATHGVIGSLGAMFVSSIDSYMISYIMVDLKWTAIYATNYLYGAFIAIPAMAIRRIAAPVLSNSWKEKDMENIRTVYKKSALTMLIFGMYVLLGIWYCIDYVYDVIGGNYYLGKNVILLIGIGHLFELGSGVNEQILGTSKDDYKVIMWANVSLLVFAITMNLILIPNYGIEGAAFATALSYAFVNLIRFLYLRIKYKLSSISLQLIGAFLVGLGLFFAFMLIPKFGNPLIGILTTGGIVTVVYWSLIFAFRFSPDINNVTRDVIIRIIGIFRR